MSKICSCFINIRLYIGEDLWEYIYCIVLKLYGLYFFILIFFYIYKKCLYYNILVLLF